MKTKLVRDYIPSILAGLPETPKFGILSKSELMYNLTWDKLTEEVGEFRDALTTKNNTYQESIQEAADVLEVLVSAIAMNTDSTNIFKQSAIEKIVTDIVNARREKVDARGGFSCGFYIEIPNGQRKA